MSAFLPRVRSWIREPLVHFLAMGAAMVLLRWWAGSDSRPIVVGQSRIESLTSAFSSTWRRPPTPVELKGLIDDFVREEIAVREARALGLDRADASIRRRLRTKLEFVLVDAVDTAVPADAELEAWLRSHAGRYRIEPRLAFRQIFFRPDGTETESHARALALLDRLRDLTGSSAVRGDPTMLPDEVSLASESTIGRTFGSGFAAALVEVEPGRWAGPISSAYGTHIVYVRERIPGRVPALEEARAAVMRDLLSSRRDRRLEAMYERLLARHTVEVGTAAASGTPRSSNP